jgi:two-component system KDP operon response regulator KdpE
METTLRVLAVARNETTLRLCLIGLGYEGVDVVHATDGDEAIELAVRHRPDVIVMDTTEPHLGPEALRELKAHAATGSIPVVILRGAVAPGERIASWIAGAAAQIAKPFSLDELSQTVRRFGRMSRDELWLHRADLLARLHELT